MGRGEQVARETKEDEKVAWRETLAYRAEGWAVLPRPAFGDSASPNQLEASFGGWVLNWIRLAGPLTSPAAFADAAFGRRGAPAPLAPPLKGGRSPEAAGRNGV